MGRTSTAKDRLIEAMIELIWTGSYGSTSVDQICERAGVKKGSFYHFFESKTALAVTSIEHGWTEHRKELDQIFSPVVPPVERILNCFRNFPPGAGGFVQKAWPCARLPDPFARGGGQHGG
jgi:TetR/AcrR family transcriptional repressor of nem operon